MFVNVNQMTGLPVPEDVWAQCGQLADAMKALNVRAMALVSQQLGPTDTLNIVSEMLYGILPEEAVVVAMDILRAELQRMSYPSQETPPVSEPCDFLP